MIKAILIALTLLSVSGSVRAGHMTTGNELMQLCVSAPDKFCAGYIVGVIETNHTLFCIPPDVTTRKIVNITIIHLRDHPNSLGLYAPNLVIRAIRSAFPCKDGRM